MQRPRRRAVAIVSLAVASTFGMLASCSFPDLTFAPDGSAPPAEASPGVDGTASATGDGTVGADGNTGPDGSTVVEASSPFQDANADVDAAQFVDDGGSVPDATVVADAASCNCDCDQDTYADHNLPGCAGAPGAQDCDDHYYAINPGAGFIDSLWPSDSTWPHPYDWNCDTVVSKLTKTNVTCNALTGCTGTGFSGDPACGQSANYGSCGFSGLTCGFQPADAHTQACQ